MNISLIGGGVMAEAIVNGILGRRIAEATDVWIGEPVESRREDLSSRYGIATTRVNREAVQHGDLVILAVKPQQLDEILDDLHGTLASGQAVISIMAGVRIESIATGLKHETVIRVMPNTPSQISEGMSVWTASKSVSHTHKENTRAILKTLGEELYVDSESHIDIATALSGSGPAYVFLFIESMVAAGVKLGMAPEVALRLTLQTVLGSAKLTQETGKHPTELRNMVTSPGGTTAEALKVLAAAGFENTILQAITAAHEKAKQLGDEK